MPTIMLPWTHTIGLRHQGVLVSAIRGCDTAVRHDPSKLAQRLLRGAILTPHAGRFANPKTYIRHEPGENVWWETVRAFSGSWDHYPHHYVMHFLHAAEIVGYYGPQDHPVYAQRWLQFYNDACYIKHMNPETKEQLDYRLNADEKLFHELQEKYYRD